MVFIGAFVFIVVAFLVGHSRGFDRGVDEGWVLSRTFDRERTRMRDETRLMWTDREQR